MAPRHLFVCGLHRSGTSVLHRALRRHPEVSGFEDTGVVEDEGQYLQSVLRPDGWYGGPGLFGFSRDAHLDETSPMVSEDNARQLYLEWARYWDLNRAVLLEKSPTDLVRMRLLQGLFPDSSFIVIMRHPIAVSMSTKIGRRRIPFFSLVEHWVFCHEWFLTDASYLNRLHVVWYEDLCAAPQKTLDEIWDFLELQRVSIAEQVRSGDDTRFTLWNMFGETRTGSIYLPLIIRMFEKRVAWFGYSLRSPKQALHRPFRDLVEARKRKATPHATVLSWAVAKQALLHGRHLRDRLR